MSKIKVLFAAAEAVPFIKTGGLADVAGSLPYAFDQEKYDVRVILPCYTCIAPRYRSQMKDVMHTVIFFNGQDRYLGLRSLELNGLTFYFVDNEAYFGGSGPYTDYTYDIEKFTFFCRSVLAILPIINFQPDIIHCHDWHTGLIAPYLKTSLSWDPFYQNIKTIFTIHNLKFQGLCSREFLCQVSGLPWHLFTEGPLCSGSGGNMMKGAIQYSDKITTVSDSYAEEIKTPEYGETMDGMLLWRSPDFCGIVNGIDYSIFDPSSDPSLAAHYSASTVSRGKAASKAALQKELGLAEEKDSFLIGMVSRLTEQKGLDLVIPVLERLTTKPCQFVVLGTGDYQYEHTLWEYAASRPDRMKACLVYDEALSHRIYAGCDAFLMPSRFEPCGLSQLIALRYGTLPIVRATGGLKDTVIPYDKAGNKATGFAFENYDWGGISWALDNALDTFLLRRKDWNAMRQNAMKQDYSWTSSAKRYEALYEGLL